MTVRPYSSACSAVMRAPPLSVASTTTATLGQPGDDAVAHRERLPARLHAVRRARSPAARTRGRGRTARGGAAGTRRRARCRRTPTTVPPASSAPSCAAASMPMARPLTTVIPARPARRRARTASARPCGRRGAGTDHRHPAPAERLRPVALGEQHRGTVRHLVDRVARPPVDVDAGAARRQQPVDAIGVRRPPARCAPALTGPEGRRPRRASHSTADAEAALETGERADGPATAVDAAPATDPGSCRGGTPASPPRSRPDRARTPGFVEPLTARLLASTTACSRWSALILDAVVEVGERCGRRVGSAWPRGR